MRDEMKDKIDNEGIREKDNRGKEDRGDGRR